MPNKLRLYNLSLSVFQIEFFFCGSNITEYVLMNSKTIHLSRRSDTDFGLFNLLPCTMQNRFPPPFDSINKYSVQT